MMRKFSWILLVLLVLAGCGDECPEDEEKAIKDLVQDGVTVAKEITWDKDGAEMVLIPGGSFEMGAHHGRIKSALPIHEVILDEFYMDVNEVTVGQFKQFVNQSGYDYPDYWDKVAKRSPGDEYPMVVVSWHDAVAYAKWAGKRLPTEAAWEYAARGGLIGKRYPWGNEVSHDNANYDGTGGKDVWEGRGGWSLDGGTAPVGSFAPNGYGLYDMAGNVKEWCQDWYDFDYYSKSPTKNPRGPGTGSDRVLRGGNWDLDASYLRLAYRRGSPPGGGGEGSGFRCVADVK